MELPRDASASWNIMNPAWPKRNDSGQVGALRENGRKRASPKTKSLNVLASDGNPRKCSAPAADRTHLRAPRSGAKAMKKSRKDPVREDRIHNEAIVDAGPEEQALSWYYYLESKIRFPFQAKCLAAKVVSPLRKGETVEVMRMAPDDVCAHDMLVPGPMAGSKHGRPARPTHRCRSRRINR